MISAGPTTETAPGRAGNASEGLAHTFLSDQKGGVRHMLANPHPDSHPVASDLIFQEAYFALCERQSARPSEHLRIILRIAPDLWRKGDRDPALRLIFEALIMELAAVNEQRRVEVRSG